MNNQLKVLHGSYQRTQEDLANRLGFLVKLLLP
jgi:hypothetical protein